MKTIKSLSLIFASILMIGLTSCSNDDDSTPPPVNEEEVITTLIVTLASPGNPTITMTSNDPESVMKVINDLFTNVLPETELQKQAA